MTNKLILYSGPLSMFGAKVEIAVREKALDFELVMVAFNNRIGYSPKHPDVVRINPKQQVPVLINNDLELFDSTQIFEYVEDLKPQPPLWPGGSTARALARQIEHKSDEVYFPHIVRLMGLQDTPDDPIAIAAREAAAHFYREMEQVLGERDYLAGSYSYADIAFYMAQLFGVRMGAAITEETPKLLQWRARMSARPAVREVVGTMVRYLVSTDRFIPDFLQEFVAAQ